MKLEAGWNRWLSHGLQRVNQFGFIPTISSFQKASPLKIKHFPPKIWKPVYPWAGGVEGRRCHYTQFPSLLPSWAYQAFFCLSFVCPRHFILIWFLTAEAVLPLSWSLLLPCSNSILFRIFEPHIYTSNQRRKASLY